MKSRLALYAVAALVVWLGILAIGRSSALQSADVARAEVKELTALNLALKTRADRLARDSATVATDQASATARRASARVDDSRASTSALVDSVRVILRDTLSTLAEVRQTATVLADSVDALLFAVSEYRTAVDTLTIRHAEERAASDRALQSSHEALLASNAAMQAWKQAGTCKVWFVKCPTRTQSVVIGVVAGGALVAWASR